MIKVAKFRISNRPYAVDLNSLQVADPTMSSKITLNAAWFRRRRGVTVACLGQLWDYTGTWERTTPATAVEALQRMDDGRYGGSCVARWDGTSYWANDPASLTPDGIERHLAILRPMLERFPEIPPGYDGWWTYR